VYTRKNKKVKTRTRGGIRSGWYSVKDREVPSGRKEEQRSAINQMPIPAAHRFLINLPLSKVPTNRARGGIFKKWGGGRLAGSTRPHTKKRLAKLKYSGNPAQSVTPSQPDKKERHKPHIREIRGGERRSFPPVERGWEIRQVFSAGGGQGLKRKGQSSKNF